MQDEWRIIKRQEITGPGYLNCVKFKSSIRFLLLIRRLDWKKIVIDTQMRLPLLVKVRNYVLFHDLPLWNIPENRISLCVSFLDFNLNLNGISARGILY